MIGENISYLVKGGFLRLEKVPSWKGPMAIHVKDRSWYCWRDDAYIMVQGEEPGDEIYHFKIANLL